MEGSEEWKIYGGKEWKNEGDVEGRSGRRKWKNGREMVVKKW